MKKETGETANEAILRTAKDRFTKLVDAQKANRDEGLTDLKMVLGGANQWDDDATKARSGRPMLTINKLGKFVRQVTGDQRQNRPSGKVRPVDSNGDPQTAKIIEGLIRNIEYTSNAPYAYDAAFKFPVAAGIVGYWRILTEYSQDDSFDQDIIIAPIRNPLTVYMDHDCVPYQGKERFGFITERIPKEDYERQYPKDEKIDWPTESKDFGNEWYSEEGVIVAEYFYKEPVKTHLYLLETGETVSAKQIKEMGAEVTKVGKTSFLVTPEQTFTIVKEREAESHKIMWCKMSGKEVLEGPREWAGKFIPIIPVFPEEWIIEGKSHFKGIIRDARDPQRITNYTASQNVEAIALSPKSPFIVGQTQIQGHEGQWKNAHRSAYPYLIYNDQNANGQAPRRADPVQVQPGLIQAMQQAQSDLHETTGIYPSSLGTQDSTGQSGRAILAKQKEADVGTFEYKDNLSYAIQFSYKVLIDLIPRIYDTARVVRLLNEDGSDTFAHVNQPTLDAEGKPMLYDLSTGKYDVAVTVGPSYTTQRMEAAEAMQGILQAVPNAAPVLLPRLFKMYDWPEAQEIAQEIRQMMAPQPPQGMPGAPGMPGMPQQGPPQQPELSPEEMIMAGMQQGGM